MRRLNLDPLPLELDVNVYFREKQISTFSEISVTIQFEIFNL